MSLADRVKRGPVRGPVRLVLHGPPKVGKTTWAAQALDPLFICAEDGLGLIDVPHVPDVTRYADVLRTLDELEEEDHGYKTLVIDSADWLESLIDEHVASVSKKPSLQDVDGGFGSGTKRTAELFRRLLRRLDEGVIGRKKMHVIFIAHSENVMFKDPDGADYLQWSIKCSPKGVAPLLREWPDFLLFANLDRTVKRGKVDSEKFAPRRLYTTNTGGGYEAGNRIGLPDELPFTFDAFRQAVKVAWERAYPPKKKEPEPVVEDKPVDPPAEREPGEEG